MTSIINNNKLNKTPIEYLTNSNNFYFDGITFEKNALINAISLVGDNKIMFGTDNPFFPPINYDAKTNNDLIWTSTEKNQQIINDLPFDDNVKQNIFYKNAINQFNLGIQQPQTVIK